MKRAQVFCVILTIFLAVVSQCPIAAAQVATQTGSETIESYDRATERLTIRVAYIYQWPQGPTLRSFTIPPEEDLLGEVIHTTACTRVARTIRCPSGTTSFSISYRYQLQINVTGDGTQFTYLSDFDREFAPTDATYDLFYPSSWSFLSVSPVPTVAEPGHFQWVRQNISAFVAQVRFQIATSSEPQLSKMMGPSCQSVGNPCDPGSGNKYQAETDYTGAGVFPLLFQRFYNSLVPHGASIGENWTSSYSQNVTLTPSELSAVVTRPDGRALTFASQGNTWIPDADVTDTLDQLTNAAGNITGWRYTTSEEDTVETYNAAGQLVSITNRAGLTQRLDYDAPGRLMRVIDPFGRTLTFTYDAADRIATLTDPAGGVYTYSYDAKNNLASVRYPNGATRTYQYEDARFPNALTGIIDENGQRFATFAYDANGKVTLSTHAGGAGQVTLTYNADGTTTVTDALGTTRTYTFATIQGVIKNTAVSTPCTACGNVTAATTYDTNGNVASRTDFNGHVTQYTYDLTRNLEASRVEAFGTPEARTITTAWHPVFRLPTHRAEPLRLTTLVYDDTGTTCGARGALCSMTGQATTDPTGAQGLNATVSGSPRTWAYTYDSTGQILTIDGPRSTVQDLITQTYDTKGNLASITNALGHVTQITLYDAHGKPLTITDPNGLVTTLAYDARQRLTTRAVGTETTAYAYDAAGQLTRVTLPDGSFLAYSYDLAHRVTAIQDSAGNRIGYTLDAMGNRVKADIFDPAGQLRQTRSRVYDGLNRLAQEIGAEQQATQYAYDLQGNRTHVTDPLNRTTVNGYDALNRLVSMTDPANGTTLYAYDGLDQLISVTDPRTLATHYTVTGLNELTQILSPDTGTTQHTYDEAGNLVTSTDAKGQTTSTTYDALNRVIQVVYADGATHTYTYDQGLNGIGRLTQITDPSGTTSYAYDLQGRVVTETRVIGSTSYVTGYQYNAAGQRIAMTSPSGHVVGYAYDTTNRIAAVMLDGQPLLSAVGYQPFGGVADWTFANSAPYTRGYDLDGRVETYTLGTETRTLTYDPASRIVGVDASDPQRDQTFDYDALDRLTQFLTPSTTQTYAYDAVGNRTGQTIGTNQYSYQIAGNSNRLLSVSGPTPKTYIHDANGSITQDSLRSFVYDARNRLVQANSTQYAINALGQRVRKTAASGTAVYHYDTAGHLSAESDAAGTGKEYIYLYDIPVAMLAILPASAPQLYYLYTDHLNTPRLITDTNNRVVWRWDNSDPFGATLPEEDPDGDGPAFTFNLRFPGQYFDAETGLHYNYFRDYEPSTGRYLESDPIGLAGGVNTYAYVGGDPLSNIDLAGLFRWREGLLGTGRIIWGTFNVIGGGLAFIGGSTAEATVLGIPIGASVQIYGLFRIGTGWLNIRGGIQNLSDAFETRRVCPPTIVDLYAPFGPLNPNTPFGINNPSTPFGALNPNTPFGVNNPSTPFGPLNPNTPFGVNNPSTPFGALNPNTPFGVNNPSAHLGF